MALATKCPHCNTVFRVAHDQLKLRGGIVRCGSCNEVFDGNAALLEPPAALPPSIPLDQKMAALDTRAAEVLGAEEAPPTLELDLDDQTATVDAADGLPQSGAASDALSPASAPSPALVFDEVPVAAEPSPSPAPGLDGTSVAAEPEPELLLEVADDAKPAREVEIDDEPVTAAPPAPIPLPAEPAILPANTEALFDLDLDIESEPDLEASSEPDVSAAPLDEVLNVESMSEAELEAALEAELQAMEQTLADVQHDADGQPIAEDAYADMTGGRLEPSWGEPSPDDEPQAGAGPGLDTALAAAADAVFAAEAEDAAAAGAADDDSQRPTPARPLRDDELDEVDEEALVQLSSNGLAEAQAARGHAYLHAHSMDDLAPANEEQAAPEEPGFVKRDRQRQKFGKAATIAMSLGSVLLVAALLAQAVTTFRNSIAATVPALKPALSAACQTLGCKIELPTQIDDLTIEQGELQTLSDTTFSFTTLLRNQSATAQAWPSIELVLDDANDKRILRRVFTPRDYLGVDVAMDKGFAPHTEQAVKLYFELHELKASGYHIAVFYP